MTDAGGFNAICSDDKRFIKKLRFQGISYVTPAVFILMLLKKRKITAKDAYKKLDALYPFISNDEYTIVKLKLAEFKERRR